MRVVCTWTTRRLKQWSTKQVAAEHTRGGACTSSFWISTSYEIDAAWCAAAAAVHLCLHKQPTGLKRRWKRRELGPSIKSNWSHCVYTAIRHWLYRCRVVWCASHASRERNSKLRYTRVQQRTRITTPSQNFLIQHSIPPRNISVLLYYYPCTVISKTVFLGVYRSSISICSTVLQTLKKMYTFVFVPLHVDGLYVYLYIFLASFTAAIWPYFSLSTVVRSLVDCFPLFRVRWRLLGSYIIIIKINKREKVGVNMSNMFLGQR